MSEEHSSLLYDPEPERTFRARRAIARRNKQIAEMEHRNPPDAAPENAHVRPNAVAMVDDRNRAIRDYAVPMLDDLQPGIVRPVIEAQHFELKPVMFQMLASVGQFSGMATEDPHQHLRLFLDVSDSFVLQGVSKEALRLKLFPYSLRDRARDWLNTLPPNSVITWNDLAGKFLFKYFPPTKNAKLRNDITAFQQRHDENFYETWERFKELLRKCPHHGIPHWIQMETFYNGLSPQYRNVVDASANGALLNKSYNDAYEILERIASNDYQWPNGRNTAASPGPTRKVAGIHEVDTVTSLAADVASIFNMLKTMKLQNDPSREHDTTASPSPVYAAASVSCVYCGEGHSFDNCPSNPEAVCYIGGNFNKNNNPYSNTYNPGWRQHPNFSWGGQGGNQGQNQAQQTRNTGPPGFQQQSNQQRPVTSDQFNSLQGLLKEYMAKNDAVIQTQAVSIRNIENQIGQLANALNNRPQGALPSDTEVPKREGKEHCKVITLKSGKELRELKKKVPATEEQSVEPEKAQEDEPELIVDLGPLQNENPAKLDNAAASSEKSAVERTSTQPMLQKMPFPQRFAKKKEDQQFNKFLDVLKQLHINIPLVEAFEQMPTYVKFMKDILSKKRRLGEYETVALTKECSSILQNKLPQKLKDPGSFTIPCTIGNTYTGRALCDLGASINLMPMSVFKKLGVGEARPTTVTLQLADRSFAYPEGKIEDVLVKVDKFIFPVDFIVLDYEADKDIPIILGRPFLATGRALIDVQKGELTMRVHDQEVTFNVLNAMKFPTASEECSVIDILDSLIVEKLGECCSNIEEDSAAAELEQEDILESEDEEDKVAMSAVVTSPHFFSRNQFEPLQLSGSIAAPSKPSIEDPPLLELKPLPPHLKYAFLGHEETLPVIISSTLSIENEEQLLRILRKHKRAMGWKMADIKGISPSLCMHKILLEESYNNSIEPQ